MNKENKLLDLFWKSLTVSIIIGILLTSMTYLIVDYPNPSNEKIVNISFIKDIYNILFSIFAPFIGIYLFNDWKEQHNAQIKTDQTNDLINKIKEFKIELPKLYTHYLHFNSEIKKQKPSIDKIAEYRNSFVRQLNIITQLEGELNLHILDYTILFRQEKGKVNFYEIFKRVVEPVTNAQNTMFSLEQKDNITVIVYKDHFEKISKEFLEVASSLTIELLAPLTERVHA